MNKYKFLILTAALSLSLYSFTNHASAMAVGGAATGTPIVTISVSASSCPLITTYMKLGWKNDGAEVAKLQSFLKNSEGLNVDVTGTFDAKTNEAVIAFQRKYLSDILGPWTATKPSGMVYITTLKKINQLACSQPLVLTAADMDTIKSYKQDVSAPKEEATPGIDFSSATTTTVDFGINDNGNQDTNADVNFVTVGNASLLQRFWSFFVNLFR